MGSDTRVHTVKSENPECPPLCFRLKSPLPLPRDKWPFEKGWLLNEPAALLCEDKVAFDLFVFRPVKRPSDCLIAFASLISWFRNHPN